MDRQRLIGSFRSLYERLALRRGVTVPIAPAAAIAIGATIALGVLAMPIAILEGMAVDSGVAALFTAAQPPLGLTARLAAAFFAGLASGGLIWFALTLLVGKRTIALQRRDGGDGVPVLRRADAHPDAPARRPVFAGRDLGTPFLEIKAEPAAPIEDRDLPLDLDTPMATYLSPFDPPLAAPAPMPIVRLPEPAAAPPISTFDPAADAAPAPLSTPAPKDTPLPEPRFAPHERIETFVMPPANTDPAAPLPQATIHDLLERLERGVARRQPAPAPDPEPAGEPSLEDTLDALRALARRVG